MPHIATLVRCLGTFRTLQLQCTTAVYPSVPGVPKHRRMVRMNEIRRGDPVVPPSGPIKDPVKTQGRKEIIPCRYPVRAPFVPFIPCHQQQSQPTTIAPRFLLLQSGYSQA